MPIYEYRCAKCGAVSEFLDGVGKGAPARRCASCGSAALKKIPSAGRVLRGGSSAAMPCDPSACGRGDSCESRSCGGACGLAEE
jgi:putative FmdB family regulatory protein